MLSETPPRGSLGSPLRADRHALPAPLPLREEALPAQDSRYASEDSCSRPAGDDSAAEGFETILHHELQAHRVRYCVLSPAAWSPDGSIRRVELAVHSEDWAELLRVLCFLGNSEYRAVQIETVAAGMSRIHFAHVRRSTPSFRTLEVLKGSSACLFLHSADRAVERRRKQGSIWVAAAEDEYRYLLVRSVCQGSRSDLRDERLLELVTELSTNRTAAVIRELFGKRWQSKIHTGCLAGNPTDLTALEKKQLWFAYCVRHPWQLAMGVLGSARVLLEQWLRPPGLLVSLLGPDGVGKSTFSAKILEVFRPVFRNGRVLQWRPQVIKPRKKYPLVFDPPHSKPPHGRLESIARLAAVLVDYWVGQIALVKPLLARAALVVYDRDFHDILVDTYRYRYGGPRSLLAFAKRLVPRGECLFLTLEAEPKIILQRKQEVDPREVERQCVSYRQLAAELPNSHLIRTDRELDEALAEVSGILVSHLNERFERRSSFS